MHKTQKGNKGYFVRCAHPEALSLGTATCVVSCAGCWPAGGRKAHIGVDAESGLTQTVVTTAAHVNDVTQAHAWLDVEDTDVFGDAGYQGVERQEANQDKAITWYVAMRPDNRRLLPDTPLGGLLDKIEQANASIRAKVEHPFRVIKRQFGDLKTRDRDLKKNAAQIVTLFALSKLFQARHGLALRGEPRPWRPGSPGIGPCSFD